MKTVSKCSKHLIVLYLLHILAFKWVKKDSKVIRQYVKRKNAVNIGKSASHSGVSTIRHYVIRFLRKIRIT